MRTLITYIGLILAGFVVGYYGRMPENHMVYPERACADAKFYNYSGHDPEMLTSDIIFTLISNFGSCDKMGRVEIKETGEIGVCTHDGWKIIQPDQ